MVNSQKLYSHQSFGFQPRAEGTNRFAQVLIITKKKDINYDINSKWKWANLKGMPAQVGRCSESRRPAEQDSFLRRLVDQIEHGCVYTSCWKQLPFSSPNMIEHTSSGVQWYRKMSMVWKIWTTLWIHPSWNVYFEIFCMFFVMLWIFLRRYKCGNHFAATVLFLGFRTGFTGFSDGTGKSWSPSLMGRQSQAHRKAPL